MFRFIGLCLGTLVRILRARRSVLLENLALRQQLAVLKRRHPRPRLNLLDQLFWVAVRRFWSGWQPSLIVVTPETVVRWHRAGLPLGFPERASPLENDKDKAIDELEKAYAERSLSAPVLRFDPHLDNLRAEPRFRDFVRRVGLSF